MKPHGQDPAHVTGSRGQPGQPTRWPGHSVAPRLSARRPGTMPWAAAADGARLEKNIANDRKCGLALEESCADGADGPTLQENDGVIGEELACSAQQPYSTGGIGGSYSKWDDLDSDSDEETAAQATRVRATYEVVVSATKVRAKPSTSAEVINYGKQARAAPCPLAGPLARASASATHRTQGQRLATDAELDGWVRLTARVGRPGAPTVRAARARARRQDAPLRTS